MCKKRSDVQRGMIARGISAGNQLPVITRLFLSEVVDFHLEHRGQGCGRLRNIVFGSEDLALCLLYCRGVSAEGEGDLATARGRS